MPIQVKYFASLRERMGRAGDSVIALGSLTVADVWRQVSKGMTLPPNTLIAVNMEYSRLDDAVKEGDEVAFFPPVTGG
ncbi:MAG TPA: MoaD/ThiS family protein [Burkholderiales bacterium]|nr:MoaD/ThiS family protein [Burkholderiales bacterium]